MNADAPFSPTPGRPVPRDDGSHWVLVADEGVAHLLRLPEAAGDLEAQHTLTDAAAHADKADLRRDAEGRRGGSTTTSAGLDESHEEARGFAARVAQALDEALEAGRFRTLDLVAAPRFLGLLRKALSTRVAAAVTREQALDLVHEKPHELTARLFPRRH
ncbi:host attachment protein [Pelomonas sp. CA6]|uniref:host attachment protein n=1 Tax=Pelomonas sp. CA6 TaxID=2907999 RepID=UPI001F4A814E|nr:host attachment protein [Pelomonas sp. CA6]MCH7342913.1 host attachment protein [Pelomonas sp. CA6]